MNLIKLTVLSALIASPLRAELPRSAQLLTFEGVDSLAGVMETSNDEIFVSDPSSRLINGFSTAGTAISSFNGVSDGAMPYPAGMDRAADGGLVLAQKDPCMVVVYNPDGSVRLTAGADDGSGRGGDPALVPYLNQPSDVAVGPDGRLYVADTAHNRIAVFNGGTGAYLSAWGVMGYSGEYEMSQPMGVAVAGGRVYVADAGNARVMVYDLEGAFVRQVGGRGVDTGGLDSPYDVAVDGSGNLWVADNGLQKVVVYGADGQALTAYGLPGGSLAFEDPISLFASEDGTILLGDGYSGRVYAFETGVANVRDRGLKGPDPQASSSSLREALLAFGPVPLRAGNPLLLQLPFSADRVSWEVLTLDMRRVASGDERNTTLASVPQTHDMASGIYFVRTRVQLGADSRQELQKIIVTR